MIRTEDDQPRTRSAGRHSRLLLALMLTGVSLIASSASMKERLERLRSLPIGRRQALEEHLTRFETLDPRTRDSVTRLNAQVEEMEDSTERRRLLDAARRYHNWLQRLSDEQRDSLNKVASPSARLELIRRYHAKGVEDWREFDAVWLEAGAFAPRSLFATAHFLRCWNVCDESRRQKIMKVKENSAIGNRGVDSRSRFLSLNQAGRTKNIRFADSFRPLLPYLEKKAELTRDGRRSLASFDLFLRDLKEKKPRRINVERFVGNHKSLTKIHEYLVQIAELPDDRKSPRDWPSPIEQAESLFWFAPDLFARTIRPIEADYFLEHSNQLPVLSRKLLEFEETSPPWILQPGILDWLPAVEARRRLTFLYHLVHSPPNPNLKSSYLDDPKEKHRGSDQAAQAKKASAVGLIERFFHARETRFADQALSRT